jgi:hypothetical protein
MGSISGLVEQIVAQALKDYEAGEPDAASFLQEAGLLGPNGINQALLEQLQQRWR